MRFFYTLIFYLLLPFILLRLWVKNRKNPYRLKFWLERLGIGLRPVAKGGVWVHAVSVGESIAAIPLIKGLQQRYPSTPIVVTSGTATGAEQIQAGLGDSVTQLYSPYDLPLILKRFFKKLQPRLLILLETELWPNLLALSHAKQIPIVLTNARLSERSAKGYRRILPVTQEMLKSISLVAAQFQADADRFIALGLPADRSYVTGSLKFDLQLPAQLAENAEQLRVILGKDRLVWIAASTHPGEEELIAEAYSQVRACLSNVLLVSVPRHVDRTSQLEQLYKSKGLSVIKRSEQKACSVTTDVFIGDSMGELLSFYAAADLAFVGGSLVERGGQNPLEPAAVGLPILTGPHTFNFEIITEQLKQRGIEIQVSNAQQLAERVITLLSDSAKRQQIGRDAKKFVEENKGAMLKQLQLIETLINLN